MPNPVVHFEIGGKDVSGLQRFYKDVFDWEIHPVPTMNYSTIAPDGPGGIGGGIGHTDGPGHVTFKDLEPALDEAGKATTTATFSEPGEYTLRVLAWDTSGRPSRGIMAVGFQCCWTNGFVKVTVR